MHTKLPVDYSMRDSFLKEKFNPSGRRRFLLKRISFILLFLLCNVVVAFGQDDCDPLRPNKPKDSQMSNETKANASALFKSLGTAEFGNKFAKAEQDTLSKYPNADKIEIGECHLYFLCTLLKSSTTLSEDQKIDRLMDLVKIQDQLGSPPPTSSEAPATQQQPTPLGTPSASEASSIKGDNDPVVQAAIQASTATERVEALVIAGVHDQRLEQGVADARAAAIRASDLVEAGHNAPGDREAASDAKAAADRADWLVDPKEAADRARFLAKPGASDSVVQPQNETE